MVVVERIGFAELAGVAHPVGMGLSQELAVDPLKDFFEVANDGKIDEDMAKRYESLEQKDPVELDREETESLVETVISDDYVTVKNDLLRHNVLKT